MAKWVSILLLIPTILFAQNGKNKMHYRFEIGTYISIDGKLPFWQANNQWGAVPEMSNTLVVKQRIQKDYDSTSKFFKFGYGGEVMSVLGQQAKVILPEYYINSRLGKFEICAGRKREIIGAVDSTLSSGSISWSSNAIPIPKVQIGLPNYTKFIFKWLSIKGLYGHGWFGNQEYVKDYYLHQKTFFARLGKPSSKIKLHGGVVHNVQWGGVPKFDLPEEDDRLYNGKYPADLYTYANVVIPFKKLWNSKDSTYNKFETKNRFGNHVGSVDIAGEIDFKDSKILIYKQFIYETGSLVSLTNTDDGLYGISVASKKNGVFRRLVLEYLFTKNQGTYQSAIARLLNVKDRQNGNNSFYFNHAQYYDGWSYNKRTIGTPFLTPQENIRDENKLDSDWVFVNNNRIWATYGAIQAQFGKIGVVNKVSYSKNFRGFNIYPTRDDRKFVTQVSYSMNAIIPMQKLKSDLNINIAIDHGDLIKDNYGAFISFIRKW